MFVLLALEKVHRVLVVLCAVSLMWAITYLTPFRLITFERAQDALDLNVLLLLAAMMTIVAVLRTTGVFEWMVSRIMRRARGDARQLLVVLSAATAILSAFADNVTTVIFMAPMALVVSRALHLLPAALLLPVVMASNIGGTATLIGDPPNIMIGSGADLTFADFLLALAPPVAMMMFVLPGLSVRLYRREFASLREHEVSGANGIPAAAIHDPLLLRWALTISALVLFGFFTHGLTGMPTAVPAMIGAAALLVVQDVLYIRRHRPTADERVHGLLGIIEREIEWPTLVFFAFLFIAVGAAVDTGLIDNLAQSLASAIEVGRSSLGLGAKGTMLLAALSIAWVSGVLSAIIDNIPFVAVMIPIVHRLGPQLAAGEDHTVLWWALALGACLGGNGTLVGASANVTVVGIAERNGVRIGFREFARVGVVVAGMTLVVASLYLATYVWLGSRHAMMGWSAAVLATLIVVAARSHRA